MFIWWYLQEGVVVASPLKLDQENFIEQKHVSIKKSRKTKREELKDINNGCSDENVTVKKSSPKKIKISDSVHETEVTKKVLAEGKKKSERILGFNVPENASTLAKRLTHECFVMQRLLLKISRKKT